MFFLYSGPSSVTGRTLARALGARRGFPSRYERTGPHDLLVRWGSSVGEDAPETLNTSEAVSNAARKFRSLEILKEAGITVPPFSRNPSDLDFPMLGRNREHFGGTDIAIYMDEEAQRGTHDFYTQYVESSREFRIHVAKGDMIRAQVKKFRGDHEGHLPIRNYSNGYYFVPLVHSRPNRDRVEAAVESVKALGLDFGAVDVLVGADNKSYVLEVNTAPGCSGGTARAYLDFFGRELSVTPDYSVLEAEDGD